ncbi:MAG TPA: TolC family protein [Blastocatellia bacterium]|nr:TolC family protein [Blastocatellia bacterium]
MKPAINLLAVAIIIGMSISPVAVAQTGQQQTKPAQPADKPAQLLQEPPQVAPNFQAPLRPLPSAERVGVESQAALSLEEAIRLALANNNDIDTSRIDTQIAAFDLKAARGIYDPRLTTDLAYERANSPVASLFGGGPEGRLSQNGVTGTGQLNGFSPLLGGSYSLTFDSARLNSNNQFATLNPQFPTRLNLSFTQPLVRGLTIDENRRRIEVAKRNLSLTDAQFRQRVMDVVSRVEEGYWDLVFAIRNLQVQIEAVKQARTQVESNSRLVQQGVLAPIDVVAAETQVATFEQNVYNAQEAVTRAENTLKTLLLPNRTASLWGQALLPTTDVNLAPPRVELNQAVSAALANRPEIEQVEATSEINKINTKFFRNQTRPQIDLIADYSAVGLAGTEVPRTPNPLTAGNILLQDRVNLLSELAGLPVLPPTAPIGSLPENLIGGFNQSLSNLFGFRYTTARVGIRFSLPIGNRTAEANLGRSLAEGRRIENQRDQLQQSIEADVRNLLQAVRSAEARLNAAASARSTTEQQYDSEQRRLQAGLSTVFLVLERQTDLIAARGRELQAQTDLNRAIANFRRATGETLQVHNISINQGERSPKAAPSTAGTAMSK